MPIYEFYCPACVLSFDVFRPVESRNDDFYCENCGLLTSRVPELTNFSFLNDISRRQALLAKRSLDHTKKVAWAEYKEKNFYGEKETGKPEKIFAKRSGK